MKIKSFLLLIYVITGFVISLFTAVMTYIIIDEPIGMKMFSKIALTVLVTLPLIGGFSYLIGRYLSKKFENISSRLDRINEEEFLDKPYKDEIKDIDEIHDSIYKLSSRLEKSINELQTNNESLKNIIKSLSHDIKTPLTIMDGYLEEIEDGLVHESDMSKVVAILQKETDYINELSTDVIEYLQSQEFVNQVEPISLNRFLYANVFPLLRIKETVSLECEVDEDVIIMFNKIALKKILINLLQNANSYTRSGYIRIRCENHALVIEDTGSGIDPIYAEKIFEPFFCIDESRNRMKSGFGLGLSIARNLAQTNGYELFLDTNYQNGSKFILQKQKAI